MDDNTIIPGLCNDVVYRMMDPGVFKSLLAIPLFGRLALANGPEWGQKLCGITVDCWQGSKHGIDSFQWTTFDDAVGFVDRSVDRRVSYYLHNELKFYISRVYNTLQIQTDHFDLYVNDDSISYYCVQSLFGLDLKFEYYLGSDTMRSSLTEHIDLGSRGRGCNFVMIEVHLEQSADYPLTRVNMIECVDGEVTIVHDYTESIRDLADKGVISQGKVLAIHSFLNMWPNSVASNMSRIIKSTVMHYDLRGFADYILTEYVNVDKEFVPDWLL